MVQHRVIHHVAHAMHAARDALVPQVPHRHVRRAEQDVRQAVRHHAVDLFRHAAVEAAQAGLDVRQSDVQLGGGDRAGQRRVGVAVEQDDVRLLFEQDRFEPGDHDAGLFAMPAAADPQVVRRRRDAQLVEEHLRHVGVIMLAGVHDALDQPHGRLGGIVRGDGAADGGGLHELRSRTDHGDDANGIQIRDLRSIISDARSCDLRMVAQPDAYQSSTLCGRAPNAHSPAPGATAATPPGPGPSSPPCPPETPPRGCPRRAAPRFCSPPSPRRR